ncbi:MAG TPA: arginine deiminase-related protein [Chthonomonadaceae bacterium]|nr:arginine deiminase-related protein [Chthonomonadaceae bacterium]
MTEMTASTVDRAESSGSQSGGARLLMCPPSEYQVLYEINPWMSVLNTADPAIASRQWNALHRTLTEDVGASVELVTQEHGAPDMVFTANAGLVRDRLAFLSRFRHPQRQPEEPAFRRWFEEHGYTVLQPPADCHFEGEGDALFVGGTLVAGYLKRSDIAAHRWLSEGLRVPVLSVQLVDDRWYHLDTCFCPLDGQTIAYYPPAFDSYGRNVLEANFATIAITEAEALRFACNAVVIGRTVILPSGCPEFSGRLASAGFRPIAAEMSEFMKAGGACKCLTLFLR